MSAARSSSGRRPAQGRRPASGAGRGPAARGVRAPAEAQPLTRRAARGTLAGLLLFALGFAVAGVFVLARQGGTPGYLVAVSVGFVGIGVLGAFSRRVVTEVQPPPIWSPRGLARVADGAGVPATVLQAAFYGLIGVSIVGNLLVPLFR